MHVQREMSVHTTILGRRIKDVRKERDESIKMSSFVVVENHLHCHCESYYITDNYCGHDEEG